jgi:hypothetical protein
MTFLMTTLFFIAQNDDNGDSLDLFVRANSESEAVSMWLAYYELDASAFTEVRVFTVPASGTPGAIAWCHPAGILNGVLIDPTTVPVLPAPVLSRP